MSPGKHKLYLVVEESITRNIGRVSTLVKNNFLKVKKKSDIQSDKQDTMDIFNCGDWEFLQKIKVFMTTITKPGCLLQICNNTKILTLAGKKNVTKNTDTQSCDK